MRKYKLSKFANLIYYDNKCYITNPCKDIVAQVSNLNNRLIELLSFCATGSKSDDELHTWLCNSQCHSDEAIGLIENLCDCGVLTLCDHLEEHSENEFVNFLHFREGIKHADYSSSTVFNEDKDEMKTYLTSSEIPKLFKNYDVLADIQLFHPAHGAPLTKQQKISTLLFYAFGQLREATFLDLLPAMLKMVPSKGARHPYDLYLIDNNGKIFSPGFYYYRPDKHCLELIRNISSKTGKDKPNSLLQLFIVVNYERYQWRYRHSWAYKDIYLDLGHITEMLNLASQHLNLHLTEADSLCFPNEKALTDECLKSYELDI
ncbi:MAG: nitroreductase [Gammaproteobacteria bacterium]|jgi:SagB-type dehydrogenase family enzyme|nr:nitroreductase [Gammaproteobacteria bacterium]